MTTLQTTAGTAPRGFQLGRVRADAVVMPIVILVLGFYVARIADPPRYGLDNWVAAFSQPRVLQSLGNTLLVYFLYTSIGFPVAVVIAWALARIRMPFTHGLEFLFWV